MPPSLAPIAARKPRMPTRMPFITSRGIGFHDATWRSNSQFYNKDTYLTNGSHACVNMPHSNAKQLYNLITSNIYVYVYNQK